jgi:hypothetical protein
MVDLGCIPTNWRLQRRSADWIEVIRISVTRVERERDRERKR